MLGNIDVVLECTEALQDPFHEPDFAEVAVRLEEVLRNGREITRKDLLGQCLRESANVRAVNALIVTYVRWKVKIQARVDAINEEMTALNRQNFEAGNPSANPDYLDLRLAEFRQLQITLSSLPKL